MLTRGPSSRARKPKSTSASVQTCSSTSPRNAGPLGAPNRQRHRRSVGQSARRPSRRASAPSSSRPRSAFVSPFRGRTRLDRATVLTGPTPRDSFRANLSAWPRSGPLPSPQKVVYGIGARADPAVSLFANCGFERDWIDRIAIVGAFMRSPPRKIHARFDRAWLAETKLSAHSRRFSGKYNLYPPRSGTEGGPLFRCSERTYPPYVLSRPARDSRAVFAR